MVIYQTTPYTYRIKWSSTGMSYYGVRYAKNCHPSDLWVTYFTSSKYVQQYRATHGEPDIIEIRKISSDINFIRLWEHRVLTRLNVIHRTDYLNAGTGMGIPPQVGDKNAMKNPLVRAKHLEVVSSEAHRAKLKETLNSPIHKERNSRNQKIAQNRPEVKLAKSARTTAAFQNPSFKAKHLASCNTLEFKLSKSNKTKGTVWLNNGVNQKYVKPDLIESYLQNGWVFGMIKRK